ncbi:MAG: hypothetical protein KJ593_07530 [Candidatus Omnitrophica bacterium]|nr:hypothetical protein [Candidatus Omnitrophota bacterium]
MLQNVPFQLPTFRGFTVDAVLMQFRKVDYERKEIEFVEFESEQGKQLLGEMQEYFSFLF